jgi:hypothetical protein
MEPQGFGDGMPRLGGRGRGMELDKANMAKGYIVDRAIDDAAFILERIDKRWPIGK